MNRIIKGLCLTLALLCLLAAVPTAWAENGIVRGVALVKLGEYEADALPEDERPIWEQLMYATDQGIKYLEDGCYSVAGGGEDVNQRGLFTEEGEQLIPFEAALIRRLNARYLMVYYATEQTEDRQEALLYQSDGFWLGQGQPREGDTLYKGYARFYDLELRRFVGDLVASKSNASSGRLLVLQGKGAQEEGVYDENGAMVSDKRMQAGNGFLILPQREIYDEDLNLRYTSDTSLSRFSSESGYLLEWLGEGRNRIIDIDGNPVVPDTFKSVYEEENGFISTELEDGAYALIRVGGDTLATSAERFSRLSAGYYYGRNEDGYLLVGPEGIIADHLENRPEACLQAYGENADGQECSLVLNTGEWTLPIGRAFSMGVGLARKMTQRKEGEHHILYNLFTGDVMLEGDYDAVHLCGRFILAQRGTVCELYRVEYQYE